MKTTATKRTNATGRHVACRVRHFVVTAVHACTATVFDPTRRGALTP